MVSFNVSIRSLFGQSSLPLNIDSPMSAETSCLSDYSLVGRDTSRAIEKGLAEAVWYASPVPKDHMRQLLRRSDLPALCDTVLWFALIIGAGWAGGKLWQAGSWWAAVPFMIYGVLYATTSDSRWHESGHGTAFKTDWLNTALYEIASFMVMRESTVWRWSHTRHHSDMAQALMDPATASKQMLCFILLYIGSCGLSGGPVTWVILGNIPHGGARPRLGAGDVFPLDGRLCRDADLPDAGCRRFMVCGTLQSRFSILYVCRVLRSAPRGSLAAGTRNKGPHTGGNRTALVAQALTSGAFKSR